MNRSFHKSCRIGGITASSGPAGDTTDLESRVHVTRASGADQGATRVANTARTCAVVARTEGVFVQQEFKRAAVLVDFNVRLLQVIRVLPQLYLQKLNNRFISYKFLLRNKEEPFLWWHRNGSSPACEKAGVAVRRRSRQANWNHS